MAALKSIKQLRSTKEKLKLKDAVPTVPVHEYSSFSFYDFNGEPQFKQFFKLQGNHFEQLGSSMTLRGFSRLGPRMSVLDMMSLGSGMSLRSFGRLGSAFSVYGMSRLGSTVSFLAALAAVPHFVCFCCFPPSSSLEIHIYLILSEVYSWCFAPQTARAVCFSRRCGEALIRGIQSAKLSSLARPTFAGFARSDPFRCLWLYRPG